MRHFRRPAGLVWTAALVFYQTTTCSAVERIPVRGPDVITCKHATHSGGFPPLACGHSNRNEKCVDPQGRAGIGEDWYTLYNFDGYFHKIPDPQRPDQFVVKAHIFVWYQLTAKSRTDAPMTYTINYNGDPVYIFDMPSLPLARLGSDKGYARICEYQWILPRPYNEQYMSPAVAGHLDIGGFGPHE